MKELRAWAQRQKELGYEAHRLKEFLEKKGYSKKSMRIIDEVFYPSKKSIRPLIFTLVLILIIINGGFLLYYYLPEDEPNPFLVGYTQTATYRGIVNYVGDGYIEVVSNNVTLRLSNHTPYDVFTTDNVTIQPTSPGNVTVGEDVQVTAFLTKDGERYIQDIVIFK